MGKMSRNKEKNLVIVLIGLCLVIFFLVFGIVLVKMRPKGEGDGSIVFGLDNTTTDCSDIDKLTVSTHIINCLGDQYNKGDEDGALDAFQRRIDSSFEEKDYDLALKLIVGRSYMYYLDDNCEKAIDSLEDERVVDASSIEKYYFYADAEDLSLTCENSKKAEYYENLVMQFEDSEESYGE